MEASDIIEPPILIVMGVSGSGKTTVATELAQRLQWDLQEGDDLHPATNVEKMAQGIPLTDEDRWPWLAKVGDWIDLHRETKRPGIVTCSALKRSYRNALRLSNVVFVHLDGDLDILKQRMASRQGHFMPVSLLPSQLDTLEPLAADERGIVVSLGATPDAEVDEIMERLDLQRWDQSHGGVVAEESLVD